MAACLAATAEFSDFQFLPRAAARRDAQEGIAQQKVRRTLAGGHAAATVEVHLQFAHDLGVLPSVRDA